MTNKDKHTAHQWNLKDKPLTVVEGEKIINEILTGILLNTQTDITLLPQKIKIAAKKDGVLLQDGTGHRTLNHYLRKEFGGINKFLRKNHYYYRMVYNQVSLQPDYQHSIMMDRKRKEASDEGFVWIDNENYYD